MKLDRVRTTAVCKMLSPNDTGETGGHQAGILVPKDNNILSFFPELDESEKNPRTVLRFEDEAGCFWKFSFIYYNNKRFGGTRDEYRLTGMTAFIRQNNLKTGDRILFHSGDLENLKISYERRDERQIQEVNSQVGDKTTKRLKLGNTWKVISM